MKKKLLAYIAIFFLSFLPSPLVSQPSKSLDWQIQFLNLTTRESKSINEEIAMQNGGRFRLAIKADMDSYCYVVCYSSEKELYVWPDPPALRGGTPKNYDFNVTGTSVIDTIYVIMSLSRQTNLEKLIESYKKNQSSRQNINNVYYEVVNLQNIVNGLGEPVCTIIPGGVTSRSTDNDDQNFATKFSGKEIYVRPITISH